MENLIKAFIKFQAECPPIRLNSTVKVATKNGGSYTFNYADLGEIHKITKPILNKYGLAFTQAFFGKQLNTILMHESGEQLESVLDLEDHLKGKDAQGAGGIITYFKRYALSAILGIVTEEDDDANSASGNKATKETKDDMPVVWMTPKQFDSFMKADKDKLSKVIAGYSNFVKDGKKYAMKKNYKTQLENQLKSL